MRAAGVLTLLILTLAAPPAAAAPYSSVTAVGKTGNGILRFPQAVAYNDRIQQFTPGGTFVRSFGATGAAPGQFQLGINGVLAIRGFSLFVAHQNNHRVQRFTLDASGAPTGTPLTFGSFGTGPGQLDHPQGLGVDANAVYVADDRNDRVVKFSHAGAHLGTLGTTGTGPSQFRFAYDAGVDSRGRLYVADNNNHRVQEFEAATFAYHRRWGLLGTEIGRFGDPRSLAGVKGDPAGGVYVGNTSNNRVDQFAPDATHRGSFGVNARGPGLFMQPKSAAAAPDGSLWVADTFSDRVQKLSAAGDPLASHSRVSTFGPAPGGNPGEFRNP